MPLWGFLLYRHPKRVGGQTWQSAMPAGNLLKCAALVARACGIAAKTARGLDGKKNGHKQQCKTMKATCESKADEVVRSLSMENQTSEYFNDTLSELDCEGTYVQAVEKGLFPLFNQIIKKDVDVIGSWGDEDEPPFAAVHFILTTAFRGERRSRAGTGGFSKMDVDRVAAFFDSCPDAFESLLEAMHAIIGAIFEKKVCRHPNPQMQAWSYRIARDVITGVSMLFYKRNVPEAIFGSTWTAESAARAQATGKTLKAILSTIYAGERTGVDRTGTIEGNANQLCGLLSQWIGTLGGNECETKFEKILNFKGQKMGMYQIFGKKLAEASIAKGRAINMTEMQQLMG